MLESVTATEFLRPASQGRTAPILLMCEDAAGETVEVFCKLSSGCDAGVSSLSRESIGACLAADLGLPVPRPYWVRLPPEFIESVSDETVRQKLGVSSPVGFGSLRVPNQFAAWAKGNLITDTMMPDATGILIFDAII
ncbi:HipA family kinase, partial [Mesorhizobium sp. M7A.F.Ca.CA.003.01.2.1]